MDYEQTEKEAKAEFAKNDFNMLIKPGNIGFYEYCEITYIFFD